MEVIMIIACIILWMVLGLVPWFLVVDEQGYIGGEDMVVLPTMIIGGPVVLITYLILISDPIYIELPWRKK